MMSKSSSWRQEVVVTSTNMLRLQKEQSKSMSNSQSKTIRRDVKNMEIMS